MNTAQWLIGQSPSGADTEVFNAFTGPPNVETHPSAFAWYMLLSYFTADVRASWPASPAGTDMSDMINGIKSGVRSRKPAIIKNPAKAGKTKPQTLMGPQIAVEHVTSDVPT